MKNKILAILLAVMFLLGGCEDAETKAARDRADEFLENFSVYCEGYELLDYVYGSSKTYPIQLAIIAKSNATGSSNVLFVVSEDGFGTLGFGDNYCIYREEDGIKLEENVVVFSLDVLNPDTNEYEIYDYSLEATIDDTLGYPNIKYKSSDSKRESD